MIMKIDIYNFGPIKEAHVETKKYNFFIGTTSSGKSVMAKLITIGNEFDFKTIKENDRDTFCELLREYSIDYPITDTTRISIVTDEYAFSIDAQSMSFKGLQQSLLFDLSNYQHSDYSDYIREIMSYASKSNQGIAAIPDYISSIIPMADKQDLSEITQAQQNIIYYTYRDAYQEHLEPVYIPAERMLLSLFTNSIFSLISKDVNIPNSIKKFGSLYERAKRRTPVLSIDFMGAQVHFKKESPDTIQLEDKTSITFSQASSGFQSIIPMWTVLCDSLNARTKRTVTVEEPELNAFPTLQNQMVMNMMKLVASSQNNIVVTTHSPYVLSVVDNLIYAHDVYAKCEGHDDLKSDIAGLIDPTMMIDFDDVSAYEFTPEGVVRSTLDYEIRSTGAYTIDQASNATSDIYNRLGSIDNEL